jgi:hypothetical protein
VAGSPEFVGSGGAPGRESGGARPRAHLVLGGDRTWGRKVAGELARWRTAAAAAVRLPARGPARLPNKRMLGLECEIGKLLGVSADDERARGPELSGGGG